MLRGYVADTAFNEPVATEDVPTTSLPPFDRVRTGVLVAVDLTFRTAPMRRITHPSRLRSSVNVIGVPSNS